MPKTPALSTRVLRILMLMVAIWLLVRIPKGMLLPLVRIGIPAIIMGSVWISFNRFADRMKAKGEARRLKDKNKE